MHIDQAGQSLEQDAVGFEQLLREAYDGCGSAGRGAAYAFLRLAPDRATPRLCSDDHGLRARDHGEARYALGPYLERGDMVVFGPVLTDDDSYGLAVVDTDDEQALREFAAQDPVVRTGTAAFEIGRLASGHVRPR